MDHETEIKLTFVASTLCRAELSHHIHSFIHHAPFVIDSISPEILRSLVEKMYCSSGMTVGLAISLFCTTTAAAPLEAALGKRSAAVPNMAGAPAVFGAGTYPRANKLSDGTILGVYTSFEGGNTVIKTVLSGAAGDSWAAQGEVTSVPTDANDLDNPYVLQLTGSSRILCAFRNHSKDPSTGAYTFFRITVAYSDDNGKSWTFLSTPASDPGPVNGLWEPFLRNAGDGVQIYYSRENSVADQDTLMRTSSDGGFTWSDAKTISGDGIISRDGMTGVATIGGKVIAVFESESNGLFSIMSITSNDDGASWGNRATVYSPDSPNTSAGAPQVVNVGGALGVSFMTNEDSQNAVPSSSYTANTAAKFVTSPDGGNTWGNKVTVGQVQSVWPGLLTLDNSNLLMMFDDGGAKAQKITLG